MRPLRAFAVVLVAGGLACVESSPKARDGHSDGPAARDAAATTVDASLDAMADDGGYDADAATDAATLDATVVVEDPMANHLETREALLTLFQLRPFTAAEEKTVRADLFLALNVGPAVTRMNQGNKAIAHHSISREACLRGLEGVVLQTDAQRERCGAPNMVPVYRKGDPTRATYCIDIFEFPNKPCALPFVWTAPTHARTMCTLQGKRLCTQGEWNLACRADPSGGPDRTYAYGDDLDLTICNTNKRRGAANKCSPVTAQGAWQTCSTDTEPSGAFPRCRSRFGVYDQHGNVAEVMTRTEKDGSVVTQLKGSAFFYAEVARKPDEPQAAGGPETYPDDCNFDPRWHVEPIDHAWHINYHLGFRCCKSIPPLPAASPDAGADAASVRHP